MIAKILIANRGEIVRRIIKTAKKMQIQTVVLYTSDEDHGAWISEANEAVLLQGNTLAETFLNTERICEIAIEKGCQAIHPGYGFLSENAQFASLCHEKGIHFIGPSPEIISLMGDKQKARQFAAKHGIPLAKGVDGTIEEILTKVQSLTFPVIIKASAGGGGKAMHIVKQPSELSEKLALAQREALSWFGNDAVFVEEYFEDARHIEVQILGDLFGNIVHLFERECTLQRNYQKIIEEAPSPTLTESEREQICTAALKLAQAAKYTHAGTIEFLWSKGKFYFLEMNTRIQVEHPITEMITGIDIVEQQLNITRGLPLPFVQNQVIRKGWAIEARIYAETPTQEFRPSGGVLECVKFPDFDGVRFENTYEKPTLLSTIFDGLISKIIVHDTNRNATLEKLNEVVSQVQLFGTETNKNFIKFLISNTDVIENRVHTKYLNQQLLTIHGKMDDELKHLVYIPIIAGIFIPDGKNIPETPTIWNQQGPFGPVFFRQMKWNDSNFLCQVIKVQQEWQVRIQSKIFIVSIIKLSNNEMHLILDGEKHHLFYYSGTQYNWIQYHGWVFKITNQHRLDQIILTKENDLVETNGDFELKSPLYGKVLKILVNVGQVVEPGTKIVTIESMKTENQVVSPFSGIVDKIWIDTGTPVKESQLLISFKS